MDTDYTKAHYLSLYLFTFTFSPSKWFVQKFEKKIAFKISKIPSNDFLPGN